MGPLGWAGLGAQQCKRPRRAPRAQVRLWRTKTGTLAHTMTGHTSSVNACAFSPDGSLAVSGSGDARHARSGRLSTVAANTIKVWVTADGTERATLRGHLQMVTGRATPRCATPHCHLTVLPRSTAPNCHPTAHASRTTRQRRQAPGPTGCAGQAARQGGERSDARLQPVTAGTRRKLHWQQHSLVSGRRLQGAHRGRWAVPCGCGWMGGVTAPEALRAGSSSGRKPFGTEAPGAGRFSGRKLFGPEAPRLEAAG